MVIHARAVIGKNCMIGQDVSIGGKSGWYEVPVTGIMLSSMQEQGYLGRSGLGTMLRSVQIAWL